MSHNPSTSSGSRTHLGTMDSLKSPRPAALFLNKPLAGNGSSVSVNEVAAPTTPGLRVHLGHLLPRHTYFRAKIHIHQISSVPFVSGEFGVRWKLKNVHTLAVHKQGLLDRVLGHGEKKTQVDKGKAREVSGESGWLRDMLSPGAEDPTEDGHVGSHGRHKFSVAPVLSQGISSVSSRSSMTNHSQNLSADSSVINTLSTSTMGASSISTDTTSTLLSPSPLPVSSTPPRGMTPFYKLKEHSITWSQQLDPILKLDIDRETSQVLPCPLKLVVMQRVIPDDPDGPPQNPRLGAVYLNLAEYIGHGPVERRYLLKESKTNATLRITIEMEYVSGETHYIPPPLAKGEILTGIAGFLDQDVVKKRPRALDIYGPYKDQEELEIDLLGATKTAVPKTSRTARTVRVSDKDRPTDGGDSPSPTDSIDEADSNDTHGEEAGITFDVQRLPFAYGTKTTETLIEALFNPTKTTEKQNESPFTYYEPPSPTAHTRHGAANKGKSHSEPAVLGLGLTGVSLDRDATIGRRQGSMSTTEGTESMYSTTTTTTSSSSASIHTMTSESSRSRAAVHAHRANSVAEQGGAVADKSAPEGRVVFNTPQKQQKEAQRQDSTGVKGWWRRHTRPSTPTARQNS